MGLRIKKCSSFLIESEFRRINIRIRLLTENLDVNDPGLDNDNQNLKDEIIKNTVNSIENINKETDEKKKEILDEWRAKKVGAQSQDEYDEFENQESNFLDDIDLEGEKKAADIVWEIIPKKTDPVEVSAEKIDATYTVFDYLTKNAKKFLLVTCIGLLGWNVASNLFSKNGEAKKMLSDVKKSGVSFEEEELGVETPLKVFKMGEIGSGGSIGELPEKESETELEKEEGKKVEKNDGNSPEILKKLEAEKKRLAESFKRKTKKVVTFIDPKTLKAGDNFDRSKTIFTSAAFPFKVTNKYFIDKNFELDRSEDIKNKYITSLDRAGKDEKTGLKMLALAMTYMEGFRKGTISYETNNPGNIDNTDSGRKNYIRTLDEGIKLQLNLLKDIANAKDQNFPVGGIVSRSPYWSPDPNLRKWIPGMIFVYEGTLEQFLRVYATGCRNDNNYLNIVLSFFEEYFPGKVTKNTKIKDIINLGGKGKISVMVQKNEDESKKAAVEAAKKISDTTKKNKK
jgi:hypothetical protein